MRWEEPQESALEATKAEVRWYEVLFQWGRKSIIIAKSRVVRNGRDFHTGLHPQAS